MGATDEITTLGAVVAQTGGVLQTGPFGSQLHASDYSLTGTPLVMPINLGDNEIREDGIARIGAADVQRLRKHALRKGDIIFSRRGDVGRRSIVREAEAGWLCGTGCLAARFGSNRTAVNPEYVAHYLGSLAAQTWLQDNAVGGTMPNLNTAILSALPIWLPWRADQDAIVAALEDAHAAIEQIADLIAKKQAIKQGMMQQLLTGKTRLPGFTGDWREVKLRDAGMTYGGLTGKDKNDFGAGSASFVTFMEVMAGARLLGCRLERVRVRPDERQNQVQRGDVLFNGSSETPEEVALAAVVEFDPSPTTYLNSFCFGYRLKDARLIDPTFLAYFFRSGDGRELVASLAQGATRYNIAKTKLLEVQPFLPPIDEQWAIVDVLRDAESEIEALNVRLTKARAVKTGMMQQLLTGRTRLPVEESAA